MGMMPKASTSDPSYAFGLHRQRQIASSEMLFLAMAARKPEPGASSQGAQSEACARN